MFLQPLDLTTALRPSLLPDETLLFVQDVVGLYEGKYKLPGLQNGHAYLTTHRACYVDNLEPRQSSVAVKLKDVDRYEYYAGFLKSSPKVTLYPKAVKRGSFQNRKPPQTASPSPPRSYSVSPLNHGSSPFSRPGSGPSTSRPRTATWVCTICSFSNPVPTNFEPSTANSSMPMAACLNCGIKPSFPHILKAAIADAAGRRPSETLTQSHAQPLLHMHNQFEAEPKNESMGSQDDEYHDSSLNLKVQCSRCTFLNHPSLLICELCGAALMSTEPKAAGILDQQFERPESPGPLLDISTKDRDNAVECVKFSFRAGGEKIFHERLKNAMVQRKWLLQNAPPVPDAYQRSNPGTEGTFASSVVERPQAGRVRTVGIAGLERQDMEMRRKNEVVIGSAFEDLETLMASAKEIIALAERFEKKSEDGSTDANQLVAESAKALNMVTTKNMLGSSANSESLYLSEMSRNLAEYLTDDAQGTLRKEGGIMSLVDLWAVFNRARGGVELISPLEFEKAARLWETLKLPIRLRQFKNGHLVVQQADRTDEKTIAQILSWLQELHSAPPIPCIHWDYKSFGCGVTAQEAAQRFGWSVGVASEELEIAEERGALCREEGVEGLRFWENWIVNNCTADDPDDGISVEPIPYVDEIQKNLEVMGLV